MTCRNVATPTMSTLCRLLLLLPVLTPAYDQVVSGSESSVAFSGCPPPFPVANNASGRSPAEWCNCTTFGEIYCHNLQAVPPFRHPPSAVPWRGVYMSRQRITELRSGAFGNLRTAKLVLNFNRLTDGVQAGALAGQETSLAELQLAGCGITSLPGRLLTGMDSLARLHLWGNKLREFPVRFFRAAANLRELMLWNNELAVLQSDTLAGLWNLRRLDLDRNLIAELHKDAFRNLIELRSLHIAHNRIQALHSETFVYVNNLRVLNLAGNLVEFVYDRAFDGLSNLLSLSLADNRINYLPENVFSTLANLTDLMLQNNRLEFVWPRTFVGLSSLRRLRLAGNRLKSLPEAALRHSPALRYLDLADNNFRSLQRCAFPVSTSALRTLSVIGNPVVCNCSLAWLAAAEQGDFIEGNTSVGGHTVVWGTCRHVTRPSQSQPDNKNIAIDSVIRLARTCTDYEIPDCRFESASKRFT